MLSCSRKTKGYTLVELMITFVMIGILGAVAIPSYQDYLRKAQYQELLQMAAPVKTSVDICYQITGDLNNCSGGQNGVPTNLINNSDTFARYIFTIRGIIYVFPNNENGFTLIGDYYILVPNIANNTLVWNFTGPGVSKGYISN